MLQINVTLRRRHPETTAPEKKTDLMKVIHQDQKPKVPPNLHFFDSMSAKDLLNSVFLDLDPNLMNLQGQLL
jgi:hypothetical protein